MNEYADLEISLHRHTSGSYAVEFRFNLPGSDAEVRLGQGETSLAEIKLDRLRPLLLDPAAYGQELTSSLFSDPNIRTAFAEARSTAQAQSFPLRVRLLIGASAPELHGVRWETLNDPKDGSPLCTTQDLFFSRYLSSMDWRPVRLRPRAQLRALVAIANPGNLGEYSLAAVDVAGELARAREGLKDIPVSALPDPENGSPQKGGHATLNNLLTRLQEEEFDILYLVCHGAMLKDEPWLWLEDEEGKVARTAGKDLATRLKELTQRPRLVVLASCQSAGSGSGEALAALGPQLAEAGIPAVLAMQGNISMETVAGFMPVFFEQLQRDGQIDRALAVARGMVRQRHDYWMPVLFMRLRSGRIWYIPGFGDERRGFEKFPTLVRSIQRGECTPIIGPGLFEPLFGSPREIAQRWAETYHYPLAPHERESLPQVAQYLAINQAEGFPYSELETYLQGEIQSEFKDLLPEDERQGYQPLDRLIDSVGARLRQRNPNDPYKLLAQLDLPIYITTNQISLLSASLAEAGKDPQVVLCPWNEYVEQTETVFDRERDYYPTPQRPLVYHLFGCLSEPDSVVLTEDDYFDYLIGVTTNKDLIPAVVRRALSDTALLFLGFQLDDWNFRVLFRSILSKPGGGRRKSYTHIAAQIEPEEGRNLEPERARRYLENYFARGADISIYWGGPEDFLKELQQHWSTATSREAVR